MIENVAFFHVPKTGGLTIQRALDLQPMRNFTRIRNRYKGTGHISFGHIDNKILQRRGYLTEEFWRTSFKFCFVRNPYDRAVSVWKYTMRKHPDYLVPGTPFVEYTKDFKKVDYRLQSWWMDRVPLSYVGRFEAFEFHVREIGRIIGKSVEEVPVINSTPHSPYWKYYCPESKQRVEEYYQRDFELFGYEQDNNLLHR